MLSEVKTEGNVFQGVKTMSDREFALFSRMIYSVTGIKMPPVKKLMLSSRLGKRVKSLNLDSYRDYYDYVCSRAGMADEFHRMIDAVTTNKTDFFREPEHFKVLAGRVLPEVADSGRFRQGQPVRIWSAGCSTGEEPYTIAMVAADYFGGTGAPVSILGTDISTRVLGTALNGVYSESSIKPVPLPMRKKYILRGKGEKQGAFRVAPDVRRMVEFRKFNLMEDSFGFNGEMDIVFCRNVIIYFDRDTQVELFNRFYNVIAPGGYLFIGSSETLHGLNDRFVPSGPTVYRKC